MDLVLSHGPTDYLLDLLLLKFLFLFIYEVVTSSTGDKFQRLGQEYAGEHSM